MTRCRQLHLEWLEHRGRTCLRVRGWAESEWHGFGVMASALDRRLSILPSDVLESGVDFRTVPTLAGELIMEHASVCFVPRFPFMDGTSYTLLVYPDGRSEGPEAWAIRRPLPPSAPHTEALAIYPTAAALPVNLLRIYVHFSGPMSEGWAGRAVRACCEDTREVLEEAFLPPDPELWDPERRRLTMLLDPGRIKRGLAPNREVGYPLVEGATVKVIVDTEFRDASDQPLKSAVKRSYRIGPALRSRVCPEHWRLKAPKIGSLGQLKIQFDRPMDHALLQRGLTVCDADGVPVPGLGAPGASEESWLFTPDSPWGEGRYRLLVEPRLEDVAGNSLLRVFDRDVTKDEPPPLRGRRVRLDFSCASTP